LYQIIYFANIKVLYNCDNHKQGLLFGASGLFLLRTYVIDELTLNIWAGNGGDGIVSWKHEKGIDHAGPW
jgi:hypothetical protein